MRNKKFKENLKYVKIHCRSRIKCSYDFKLCIKKLLKYKWNKTINKTFIK